MSSKLAFDLYNQARESCGIPSLSEIINPNFLSSKLNPSGKLHLLRNICQFPKSFLYIFSDKKRSWRGRNLRKGYITKGNQIHEIFWKPREDKQKGPPQKSERSAPSQLFDKVHEFELERSWWNSKVLPGISGGGNWCEWEIDMNTILGFLWISLSAFEPFNR